MRDGRRFANRARSLQTGGRAGVAAAAATRCQGDLAIAARATSGTPASTANQIVVDAVCAHAAVVGVPHSGLCVRAAELRGRTFGSRSSSYYYIYLEG